MPYFSRRVACLVFLVVGAMVFAISAAAPLQANELATATTTVNIRGGPGTNYEVIGSVPGGDVVTVISCNSGYGWCDIDYGGQRGYVAGRYLTYATQGAYYGRPFPSVGVYVGVPLFWNNYPVYRPWPPNYRPPGYRPPGYRPPGYRPPGYRPPGYRPPGYRPPGYRPPGYRPPVARPPIARPPGTRPPGARPPGNRPPGARPPGNRPPGARPPGNRPPGARPPGGRPPGYRPPGGGRPGGGGRPRGGGGRR